jgi:hypothetical protein
MNKIDVKTLKPGMAFSAPVFIEGNNLFIPAGIAIREKDIARVISLGYDAVVTDGELLDVPELSPETGTPDAAEIPSSPQNTDAQSGIESLLAGEPLLTGTTWGNVPSLVEVQENRSAYRSYMDLIRKLDIIFGKISSGNSSSGSKIVDHLTGLLIHSVREDKDRIIGFVLGGEVAGRILAKSSVNTAILSALIALELRVPNHKVMHIITGALLHDTGMLRLPPQLINKPGGLSGDEIKLMHAHPLYAYRIITRELFYPEEVGVVALQHHERWDGEGYPRRIAEKDIDIGARIVSVADAFEAMVCEKPYRNSIMGYQAMKNILSDNSRRFDPDAIKAFVKIMGIYPIGSVIKLNTGAIARVTEVRGSAPLRPVIRILIDEFGKLYNNDEGDMIDLLTEKNIFISKALDSKKSS